MMTFKVETLHANTNAWEGQITFKPEYVMTVMKMRRRWWFPWFKNEIGVIANLRVAEKAAKEKAMHHARALFHKVPTKVIAVTEANGQKISDTIWHNGKSLKHERWPLYKRLLYGLYRLCGG